jgi:hypothetical protein
MKDCHGWDIAQYASCIIRKESNAVLTPYLWSEVTGYVEVQDGLTRNIVDAWNSLSPT